MRTVPKGQTIYAFAPEISPVMSVEPQEPVIFETIDALGGQVQAEDDAVESLDFSRVNPATGPVRIVGAEPGDALAVEIRSIELADRGAIIAGPGMGVLGDVIERPVTRLLEVVGDTVQFAGLELPVAPMIGVIGVAPEEGSFPTGTAHRHGGNMDAREIGPGATVYLPVAQPGALLAMGDVHAVMGDGEVCVSACEVSASVRVVLRLVKGGAPRWPVVETAEEIILLVSLPTIDEALHEATSEAVRALQKALSLPFEEAYLLASLSANLGVSQLVDPNKTAKAVLPKTLVGPFERWCGASP
jgi:amidase